MGLQTGAMQEGATHRESPILCSDFSVRVWSPRGPGMGPMWPRGPAFEPRGIVQIWPMAARLVAKTVFHPGPKKMGSIFGPIWASPGPGVAIDGRASSRSSIFCKYRRNPGSGWRGVEMVKVNGKTKPRRPLRCAHTHRQFTANSRAVSQP